MKTEILVLMAYRAIARPERWRPTHTARNEPQDLTGKATFLKTILSDMKNEIHTNLTLQKTTIENWFFVSSGIWTRIFGFVTTAVSIELSS